MNKKGDEEKYMKKYTKKVEESYVEGEETRGSQEKTPSLQEEKSQGIIKPLFDGFIKSITSKEGSSKWAAIIIGLMIIVSALSIIPKNSNEEEVMSNNTISQEELSNEKSKSTLEEKLKNILSQIEGAGELDVMITYESSEEIQPAFNTNTTTEKTKEVDQQGGERTVTTSSENKTMITSSSSEPIVIKTNQPKINGVIVVASGAKDPTVKETLYSAVQTALQVQGHQVEIYTK